MYLIEVPRIGLWLCGNERLSNEQILSELADQSLASTQDRIIIVLHPLQARILATDSRFKRLIDRELIKMLGPIGKLFYPIVYN